MNRLWKTIPQKQFSLACQEFSHVALQKSRSRRTARFLAAASAPHIGWIGRPMN
jgi:hypothetical protein